MLGQPGEYPFTRGIHRLVRKEHAKSDRKIDSVIGATLAYEARADVLTAETGPTDGISHVVYSFN